MMLHSSILAAFLWPGLFGVGAAAVSVPIIIHLLARRRFKRIRWPAMQFLISAERQNRRRVRMEEWILLALRCLAILLIALIVSRPFFAPEGLASLVGSMGRTERIFVLDDSYSMGYRQGQQSSFERAKLAVRRLIETVRRESPDDTVTILRTSAMDRPIVGSAYLDDAQTEQMFARVAALSESQTSIDVTSAVQAVRTWLEDQPGLLSAAVYFVSDFQRKDWIGSTRPGRSDVNLEPEDVQPTDSAEVGSSNLLAPLADWSSDDRALDVILVNVGADGTANTALTDLR